METEEGIVIAQNKWCLFAWLVCFALSMTYYVYYIVHFTANVPMLDSILLFIQYYLAFGILFGLLILLAFRLLKRTVFRFLTIAAAHAAFMPMFFHELSNFPAGSFFNGYAP